jgi:hypothetical protein
MIIEKRAEVIAERWRLQRVEQLVAWEAETRYVEMLKRERTNDPEERAKGPEEERAKGPEEKRAKGPEEDHTPKGKEILPPYQKERMR